jgi:pyruvate-formate lyase-activating enzyme/methylmalonyl-CoA mutase cobalamin-binding subunit
MPEVLLLSDEEIPPGDDHFGALKRYSRAPLAAARAGGALPHPQHLSVVALATYLRRHGVDAEPVDNLSRIPGRLERMRALLDAGPRVVGVSTSLLLGASAVRRVVDEVRARAPRAFVVLGGATAAGDPEVAALGDAVVAGHGEAALLELVRARREGRPPRPVEPAAVDELPAPDWGPPHTRPSLCHPIEASKGCRYRCAFCSYPDLGSQRLRARERVLEELERNREFHGIRMYRFMDSNLTSWPEETEALCGAIAERGLGLQWFAYARADELARRPSLAESLRRAGCVMLFCGVESGSDAVLKGMNKGYSAARAAEGVRRAKEAGLLVHANFIVGFPGETRETVDETLEWIRSAEPDTAAFSVLYLHRNSTAAVWTQAGRWGLRGAGLSWWHPSMDSEGAQEQLDRAMSAVLREMPRTLIDGGHGVPTRMGFGLGLEEALGWAAALREHHLGDEDRRAAAAEALRAASDRMDAFLRARGIAPPARPHRGGLLRRLLGRA